MAGLSGFGKTINKITGLHDKMDPLGKKLRDPLEDAVGLPRSGKIGTALLGDPDAKPPEMPKVPEAKVMPTADDAELEKARRRSLTRQRQSQGRASTILTDNTETLG